MTNLDVKIDNVIQYKVDLAVKGKYHKDIEEMNDRIDALSKSFIEYGIGVQNVYAEFKLLKELFASPETIKILELIKSLKEKTSG